MDELIKDAIEAFIQNENQIMNGKVEKPLPLCSPTTQDFVEQSKKLAQRTAFNHHRKIELEIGSYHTISILLDTICESLLEYVKKRGKNLSYKTSRTIDLLKTETFPENYELYPHLMRGLDFISGMTDNYAVYLANQFQGFAK